MQKAAHGGTRRARPSGSSTSSTYTRWPRARVASVGCGGTTASTWVPYGPDAEVEHGEGLAADPLCAPDLAVVGREVPDGAGEAEPAAVDLDRHVELLGEVEHEVRRGVGGDVGPVLRVQVQAQLGAGGVQRIARGRHPHGAVAPGHRLRRRPVVVRGRAGAQLDGVGDAQAGPQHPAHGLELDQVVDAEAGGGGVELRGR